MWDGFWQFLGNMPAWVVVLITGLITALILVITRRRDHDRSRRHATVDMMKFYIEQTAPYAEEFTCLRILMKELGEKECSAIKDRKPFQLSVTSQIQIEAVFSEGNKPATFKQAATGHILVSASESSHLANRLYFLLNIFETIACAYDNQVADQDMLFKEFKSILFPDNKFTFSTFVDSTGIYPSLNSLRVDFSKRLGVVIPESKNKIN